MFFAQIEPKIRGSSSQKGTICVTCYPKDKNIYPKGKWNDMLCYPKEKCTTQKAAEYYPKCIISQQSEKVRHCLTFSKGLEVQMTTAVLLVATISIELVSPMVS